MSLPNRKLQEPKNRNFFASLQSEIDNANRTNNYSHDNKQRLEFQAHRPNQFELIILNKIKFKSKWHRITIRKWSIFGTVKLESFIMVLVIRWNHIVCRWRIVWYSIIIYIRRWKSTGRIRQAIMIWNDFIQTNTLPSSVGWHQAT